MSLPAHISYREALKNYAVNPPMKPLQLQVVWPDLVTPADLRAIADDIEARACAKAPKAQPPGSGQVPP